MESSKLNGGSAYGTMHFGLHPLQKTSVMELMSTHSQLLTVEELSEANCTVLIGSRGGPLEQSIESGHQFVVVSILANAAIEGLDCSKTSVQN